MCVFLKRCMDVLMGAVLAPSFIRARIATSNVCRPSRGVLTSPVVSVLFYPYVVDVKLN